MTFSYTQVSQYLRCPRSYRFRYLDGWREKDSRAAFCFGRCFEKAIAALFEREDAGAVLFKEWGTYRDVSLEYSHGDDWERLLRQGIGLLEQFARDNRIRIRQPKRNTQKKIVRSLSNGNEFVAYVDAIGHLDGTRRLLEWKTTSARYPDQPEGPDIAGPATRLLFLDHWHLRRRHCGLREEARPGDSIPTGFNLDRNCPVSFPPRNPFPAERVR